MKNILRTVDELGNTTFLGEHEGTCRIAKSYNVWTGEGRLINLDSLTDAVIAIAKANPELAIDTTAIARPFTAYTRNWDAVEASKVAASEHAIADEAAKAVADADYVPKELVAYKPVPKPAWLAARLEAMEAEAEAVVGGTL